MTALRVVYEDMVGSPERSPGPLLSSMDIPVSFRDALASHYGGDIQLSPPQVNAIESGILRDRSDYLICAPTNSGKTLIAILRMFVNALECGGRAVYVVPLKALAEEKTAEFRNLSRVVASRGGKSITVSITTGDYQLTEDFLGSPPPDEGEIVVCTPERLEVMLRNPENYTWARAVSTYVIDEFHLLGENHRGHTVETLLTRLFDICPWSSVIGLSATIGGIQDIEKWFQGNDRRLRVIESDYRFPQLHRLVLLPEDKNRLVAETAQEIIADKTRSLLVFVYTKNNAVKLAELLLSNSHQPDLVGFFHSGLNRSSRADLMNQFREGTIRILVTTTSLKLGVNFPVTDVIVRDTHFHGYGRLLLRDILQMAGRAGRGETLGRALVLCDREEAAEFYRKGLLSGEVEPLTPQLMQSARPGTEWKRKKAGKLVDPIRTLILSEIVSHAERTAAEVTSYLAKTYSASCGYFRAQDISAEFEFLDEGKLIYRIEGTNDRYAATKLGKTVSFSGISPESGAVLAGFLRALIRLDNKKLAEDDRARYLNRLTDLDLLFLATACFESRDDWLHPPSKKETVKTQEYVETLPPDEKPLVNLWRSENSSDYPTRRLLATLRVLNGDGTKRQPESIFYQMMATAILLHRHSRGETLAKLACEYKKDEGSLENNLKYTAMWMLSCLAQICDSRKCYKLDPLKLKILELLEDLRFGSNLGKLMTIEGVGRQTIEKLLSAGYEQIETLASAREADLRKLGLNNVQVTKVASFVRRRSR